MTVWTMQMLDLAGTNVVTNVLAQAPDCTFGFALNGFGTVDWRLPTTLATQANYLPGARTLLLKKDGVAVWGGFLLAAQADEDWVSFSGKSWEFGLTQRIISSNERYNGTEQLDIAWDLLSTYVTYPTLTRGSATASGQTRHRTWCCDDFTPVSDAINDLAEARFGFDWWITPAKVWTTAYQFRGTNRAATVILTDSTHLSDVSYEYDTESVFNRLWFSSPNIGTCADLQLRDNNDTPAPTWVRESGTDLTEIPSATERSDMAWEQLRNASPRIQVHATIHAQSGYDFGDFDLGDTVHVTLTKGWMTTNTDMKVLDYKVTIAEDCVETIDVTLDNLTTV